MQTWDTPFGQLSLGRFPYDQEQRSLQAWNAADSLMAEHLHATYQEKFHILILNDHYGALAAAALALGHTVSWQNDSLVSLLACQENLKQVSFDTSKISYFKSVNDETGLDLSSIQLVIMQVPKSHALLEFQLAGLTTLPEACPVLSGAMSRDIHKTNLALFDKYIGECTTSLAAHKARLIFATKNKFGTESSALNTGLKAEWPQILKLEFDKLINLKTVNYASVFSLHGHDRGSLLLIKTLIEQSNSWPQAPQKIIDCGCGNGLLALCAAQVFPGAELVCADESWMAICSAREGFEHNHIKGRARFVWTDCLSSDACGQADLILCNPPFHQGRTQTDAIAKRMFSQAKDRLISGGRLLIVVNRHLGYHAFLRSLFAKVESLADDGRYLVLSCY